MEEAFIELVQKNEALIRKVCSFYLKGEDEKKDLFQEIVLQLWKAYPSFRKESKVSTWIYRIALNTAITTLRKNKKHKGLADLDSVEAAYTVDYEKQEKIKMLYMAIDQLNNLEKSLIFLHLEGYNYDEISELSGLTKTNVSTKVNRIKTKITGILQNIYKSFNYGKI